MKRKAFKTLICFINFFYKFINFWLSDVFGDYRERPNELEPKVPKKLDETKKDFYPIWFYKKMISNLRLNGICHLCQCAAKFTC